MNRDRASAGDATSYLRALESSAWLSAAPFEHAFRKGGHRRFLRRLLEERWLYAADAMAGAPPVSVLLFDGVPGPAFDDSLESLLLQSAPRFQVLVVPRDESSRAGCERRVATRLAADPDLAEAFEGRIGVASPGLERLAGLAPAEAYVLALRSGDLLHPSAVACVGREGAGGGADLVFWNEMVVEPGPPPRVVRWLRKPQLEPMTLAHLNYVSYNFAVRARLLGGWAEFADDLRTNDLHLFLIDRVAAGATARTVPEYLLVRDAGGVRAAWESVAPNWSRYQARFEAMGFRIERRPAEEGGYRLSPVTAARSLSIIIPFRDQPEATCRTIRAVLAQDIEAPLELLLVNNQSDASALDQITGCLEGIVDGRTTLRLLDYDLPFNHSAQCNLALEHATGEVVVFLNNDAELQTPTALHSMAAWSLVEGVGTVGIRTVGEDRTTVVSAGIKAQRAGPDDSACVVESEDAAFSGCNRETLGNSFACAAVARRTLDAVGLLDAVDFPIGYNDADYNLRCRRAGLRNMYLGTERAVHVPGQSRSRSDELHQKLLLRERYPEIGVDALFQLELEDRPRNPPAKQPRAAVGVLGRLKRAAAHAVRRWAGVLQGLVPLALLTGCSTAPARHEGRLDNLVLVSLDTTRYDRLGLYGYFRDTSPNLDAFARDAVVFTRAYSPSGQTLPAHLSWLTAVYPEEHGILSNVPAGGWSFTDSQRLASATLLLRQEGYETAAFVSAAPLKRGSGFESGFERFSEPEGRERPARETTRAVSDYLSARADRRPLFLFVHYFEPHDPYEPPAEFRLFTSDDRLERYLATRRAAAPDRSAAELRDVHDRYDGEVRAMDAAFGQLVAALRRHGILDQSVVVVAGDHGEGLGQHAFLDHGLIYDEQLRVPWIVRFPDTARVSPGRVDALVSTVDMLPTVFANAPVRVAPRFWRQAVGRDALSAGGRRAVLAQRTVNQGRFAGTPWRLRVDNPAFLDPQYAIVTREWKLLRTSSGREELFHLQTDPFELTNVRQSRPQVAAALRAELTGSFAAFRARTVDHSRGGELTEARLEELRALGYAYP